jgi:hypothetical protein
MTATHSITIQIIIMAAVYNEWIMYVYIRLPYYNIYYTDEHINLRIMSD